MGGMPSPTHEVTNQPPPLEGYDVFAADAALLEAVEREGAGWAIDDLHALGRLAGSPEAIEWGFDANRHPPELRTHDRYGHRIDEVTCTAPRGRSTRRAPTWRGPPASSCGPRSTPATAARSP
jgi:Adaptive response protein AidB N-terminal domain